MSGAGAYVVKAPYQVNVGGVVYGSGERFDAADDIAASLVAAGWAEPSASKSARSR